MLRFKFVDGICAALFALFALSGATAHAAASCQPRGLPVERLKLQTLLASSNVPQAERGFLLRGADRRIREFRQGMLNERGKQCGLDTVRALVLSCVIDQLPSTLSSGYSNSQKTGASFWGKANVSAGEAKFIGIFDACRRAAVGAFLNR